MKYIITEEQLDSTLTTFKRSSSNRGRLSDVIEEITVSYLSHITICDVVAPYSNDNYAVIVLTPDPISDRLEKKLERQIESLVGADIFVVTLQNINCKPVKS
jgi:hypothetical protein